MVWLLIKQFLFYLGINEGTCRSQWPRGLRHRSAAAHLLRLWFRISTGAWMSVCSECCVLSGRGLCDEMVTRPEESYRMWCFVMCDPGTSWKRRSWPSGGAVTPNTNNWRNLLNPVLGRKVKNPDKRSSRFLRNVCVCIYIYIIYIGVLISP